MTKARELRYISANKFKINEMTRLFAKSDVSLISLHERIEELQTLDLTKLVRDKVLKAYRIARRPVFVEHSGLCLESLHGLPGPLTQVFWDTLGGAKHFAALYGRYHPARARAFTCLAYCDGHRIYEFQGEINGSIAAKPRGTLEFQWDVIFIPDGHKSTFSEMGTAQKNKISMRRRAVNEFVKHLET